jgi:hypothetical protein
LAIAESAQQAQTLVPEALAFSVRFQQLFTSVENVFVTLLQTAGKMAVDTNKTTFIGVASQPGVIFVLDINSKADTKIFKSCTS